MLREFIKEMLLSDLATQDVGRLGLAIHNSGGFVKFQLYDVEELKKVMHEKNVSIPILGTAMLERGQLANISSPKYKELLAAILEEYMRKNADKIKPLVQNHNNMMKFLRDKGKHMLAARLEYGI